MRVCIALLCLITCVSGSDTIKIVKFVVPEIVQYGVQDSVILDCDFTYGSRTPGLMVKWFFRDRTQLVYQWIVTQLPEVVGILRGRVDLTYKASDDPQRMYRAMRIVKIDTDLSGEYICVVSSFLDEDYRGEYMTVFAPETNFRLIQNKTDDDTVNVICMSEGSYPAPNITIGTPLKLLPVEHKVTESNGRFSAVASVTLHDEDLPTPAEFICTLRIPEAKYSVRKEAIYYPGPITTTEIPTSAGMQLGAAVSMEAKFAMALMMASATAVSLIFGS